MLPHRGSAYTRCGEVERSVLIGLRSLLARFKPESLCSHKCVCLLLSLFITNCDTSVRGGFNFASVQQRMSAANGDMKAAVEQLTRMVEVPACAPWRHSPATAYKSATNSAQNDNTPSRPHACTQDAKCGRGAFGVPEVKSGVLAGYAVRVLGGSACWGRACGVHAALPRLQHRTPD